MENLSDSQFAKAISYAQGLTGNQRQQAIKDFRTGFIDKFFEEGDWPAVVRSGWDLYKKRVSSRQAVGNPMVPGGGFFLSYEAVLAGCLAEMHESLATILDIPVQNIVYKKMDKVGAVLKPIFDISIPDEWRAPIVGGDGDKEEIMRKYLGGALNVVTEQFRINVSTRIKVVDNIRLDLIQDIEDGLES